MFIIGMKNILCVSNSYFILLCFGSYNFYKNYRVRYMIIDSDIPSHACVRASNTIVFLNLFSLLSLFISSEI